ncbi:extracellular solute-binding protein [Treponema sp.]
MKIKNLVVCGLFLSVLIALGSCAKKSVEEAKKPETITYWLFGNPVLEADQGAPADKWYITGAAKRFEEKTGIKVEVVVLPADNLAEKFKAAGIAKNGPDVSNIWVGGMIFDNKDFILPLDPYFNAEELSQIIGLDAFRLNYEQTGALYGVPYAEQNDTLIIYYNKSLFKQAGIDESSLPTDMDAFYVMCEKLKKAKITPMVIGDKEGYYSAFVLLPIYASQTGVQGIRDLVEGKKKYSDDKDFIAAARAYQTLYTKGYTNKDVVSLEDSGAQAKFFTGQAAMIGTGPWLLGSAIKELGSDLGIMRIPALRADSPYKGVVVGGPGQGYCVTNYSANPNEAVQFVKFLISKEEVERSLTELNHGTGATPYKYVSASVFIDEFSKQLIEFNQSAPISVPWMDNQMPQEVSAELYRISAQLLSGIITPEQHAAQLDKVMNK